MREVIYLDKKENEKPVEFTHFFSPFRGLVEPQLSPKDFIKIVYLGKDILQGDMFSAIDKQGNICIYKGHLNSGKY
jgi:hypothetical protein